MSLARCVEEAVAAGRLTEEQGQDLLERAQRHTEYFELQGGIAPERARSQAEASALAAAKREVALQSRQKALQAIRNAQNTTRILNHPKSPAAGVAALHSRSLRGEVNTGNIETRARTIIGHAHSTFAHGLMKLHRKWFGLYQDTKLLNLSVREIFGESTGNADAKAIAEAWAETAENLRQRFNKAGGAIAKRNDWGLPQAHDTAKVARADKQEWIDFTLERLDREKMLQDDGLPMTEPELRFLLDTTYERIRTDGLVDMMPGQMGGKKLANRHRESRFLAFRDAEAWMEYQGQYGANNTFQTMVDHIDRMAHEIAQLEILGPNPAAAYRYLADVARKHEATPTELGYIDALNRVVTGSGDSRQNVNAADFWGAVRNWLTAARLGSAVVSAVSDIAFIQRTSRFNNMSATKVMGRFLKLLASGPSSESRMIAVRAGLTAELFTSRAMAANRWTDVVGSGFSAQAADFTMRASGMSAWTDSMKKAFGMEMMATFAESAGRTFDELSPQHRRTLEAYSITADEWDAIRTSPMLEYDGARFISSEKLLSDAPFPDQQRQTLATKWQEMLVSEGRYAVPEADARTRVFTTGGGLPRGTIGGDLARGLFQFKSFPITVILLHLYRGASQPTATSKGRYLAGLAIGTTVLGGLALQLKEISKGKDPRDMATPEFWGAAFAQGGGAGIYGDFLFTDVNRFGGGLTSTLLGPTAGLIDDTAKLTLGNIQQGVRAEDMDLTTDIIRFASDYTPGIQLWYSRTAFDRMIVEQLESMADPAGARRQQTRMERRARRDYNQDFWWRPGSPRPDRAPDLEAALGD